MLRRFAKKAALAAIAHGLSLPDVILDRLRELTRLRSLLESLRVNCVIDAGANQGQTVDLLRGIGFRGFIFSFEPLGSAFSTLSDRMRPTVAGKDSTLPSEKPPPP